MCGAHGDALKLIQEYERLSFPDAAERLAQIAGVPLKAGRVESQRSVGIDVATRLIKQASANDGSFASFARLRRFDPEWLHRAGAAVVDLKGIVEEARRDRSYEEAVVRAGIARRREIPSGMPQLFSADVQPFFGGTRLLFTLDAIDGSVAGFAARTLSDEKPKYLYSYGFKRSETLYRESAVLRTLDSDRRAGIKDPVHLYIVEGLFDALRLEFLGFRAVAVLGAHITANQVKALRKILTTVADDGRELYVSLFFDCDEAGRRGAYDAAIALLKLLEDEAPFGLDIISYRPQDDQKIDPDSALADLDEASASNFLATTAISPLALLAAHWLGSGSLRRIDWKEISQLRRASVARRVALALGSATSDRVLNPLSAGTNDDPEMAEFASLVRAYSAAGRGYSTATTPTRLHGPTDKDSDLIRAATLGLSSCSRREYPSDDASWDRLSAAASTFYHLHCARLEIGDGLSAPLLARHVPKGNGQYRLKSGPVAEDILLQQYVMMELLRDRPDCPDFAQHIPAIRYDTARPRGEMLYCTGGAHGSEAVSFAYQVDMTIVNGEAPPRREGIFRPYFDCWRDFVNFVEDRIKRFAHSELQILRLDIAGFYDNIRRDAVQDALSRPLEIGLNSLKASSGEVHSFAPLLEPNRSDTPVQRAEAATNFLLRHSFGLTHFDPIDGSPKVADARKGIPQGPDLSAYLANVALFDLDAMMVREIERLNSAVQFSGQYRASYARYVDDIILVCEDIETASQLRRKIEAKLAVLGLSLNRKNPTPPPMTREEARAWITDNRSGFGFSGPLADLPSTDAMDPLAEAGEINRQAALGLLHDPELDDPANLDRSLEKIEAALRAPDLRFNDRANAYRRVWIFAAGETLDDSAESLTQRFVELLYRVESPVHFLRQDSAIPDLIMACLEGLERALRTKPPRDLLTVEASEDVEARVDRISRAVLNDIFTPITKKLMADQGAANFLNRYDVRTQIGIMACFAAQRVARKTIEDVELTPLRKHFDEMGQVRRSLYSGLRWSLHRFDRAIEGDRAPLLVVRENVSEVAFTRLHGAIVQLQRLAQHGSTDDELSASVPDDRPEPNRLLQLTTRILGIWEQSSSVDDEEYISTRIDVDAAATLVNFTYRRFAEIAARRPRLVTLIAGKKDVVAIPSPPGLHFGGLLLWCLDGRLLLANPESSIDEPLGVTWTRSEQSIEGIHIKQADLPVGSQLLFRVETRWTPASIAEVYRAFFPVWRAIHESSIDSIPVPTVFSFFACVAADGNVSNHKMVCWATSRASVDGHAFVRNGDALEAKSVFAEGSDFWRYGWSLRDLYDRRDLATDEENGLDAQGGVPLARETQRREAIVTRVLPRLSGSDRFGPGEIKPGAIPSRIERGLNLLESFGTGSAGSDAAYVVAATAEGLFMSERLETPIAMDIPGVPVSLLVRSTNRAMRALPEAAAHWVQPNYQGPASRRNTMAWLAAGARIRTQAQGLQPSAAGAMKVLALGADVLAITADLQSLAFELAGGLGVAAFELLAKAGFEQSWIKGTVGLDLILVDEDEDGDPSVDRQMHLLVETFCEIVLGRRAGLARLRDRITPCGWAVLVAILLQVIEVHQQPQTPRPTLWTMNEARLTSADTALTTILRFLATAGSTSEEVGDWPWDAFSTLNLQRPSNLAELLHSISDASSVVVVSEVSHFNPRHGDASTGRETIRLTDGTSIGLADWQVAIAHIRGERGTATEAYEVDGRFHYRYSVARTGDRVLGIHLVSRQLARAAFEVSAPAQDDADVATARRKAEARLPTNGPPDPADPMLSIEESSQFATENRETDSHGEDTDPRSQERTDLPGFPEVRAIQRKAWEKRSSERDVSARRIALAQWDVTDTYSSPGEAGGRMEGLLGFDGKLVSDAKVSLGGEFVSTSEHRRRAILKSILAACYDFGVHGLVLPEYSVRPETVNWLARQLKQAVSPITIWCGTFRIPGGTQLDFEFGGSSEPFFSSGVQPLPDGRSRYDDHAALLTCLRVAADSDGIFKLSSAVRRKRYPSAAAGELIRPPVNEPWRPLLSNISSPWDVGAFSIELICSEMFPHASSANFAGVIEENEILARRYDIAFEAESPFTILTRDIFEFSKWTSYRNLVAIKGDTDKQLYRGEVPQRTLVILPAMTARSADYHIFGQNQYLAAGLVTVFSNAVEPHYGCGESCFIGLGGWQRDAEPPVSPYNGVAPGIFQLNGKHTGPLGRKEAALVIADLDLSRTADQKPRPHYQSRALKLVAHLPLIFQTEPGAGSEAGDYPSGHRRTRRRSIAGGEPVSFERAATRLLDALNREEGWRKEAGPLRAGSGTSQIYKDGINTMEDALKVLCQFADDPTWLEKRSAAFIRNRYDVPASRPLPALIDWIFVDDRWPTFSATAERHSPLSSDDPILSVPSALPEPSRQPT